MGRNAFALRRIRDSDIDLETNLTKQRIAVLGGGMGALSAVFAITGQPGWQDRFDITLYTLGWRLGGKAATASNQAVHDRIEEHGYHTLFGFYENTFEVVRKAFAEWDRDPALPISAAIARTPTEEAQHPQRYALKREDYFVMQQRLQDGSWHTFPIEFPFNTDLPGNGKPFPSALAYIEMALELLSRVIDEIEEGIVGDEEELTIPHWWRDLEDHAAELLEGLDPTSRDVQGHRGRVSLLRALAAHLASTGVVGALDRAGLGILVAMIRDYLKVLWTAIGARVGNSWPAYLLWTTSDFIGTVLVGFIEDDVPGRGFNAIDDVNFWQWIEKWATVPEGTRVTNASMWVQAAYDSSFAYLRGDTTTPSSKDKPPLGTPSMGAGTMLRGGMRLMLTYKGAMAWKFQAGTASVLCAPLFDVLRARGVKFEFFSKVEELTAGVDDEGRPVVEQIRIQRQVDLLHPAAGYQPMFSVEQVPCFPAEPLWDQIANPDPIKSHNLESAWDDWPGVGTRTLVRGQAGDDGFDLVLLAIPAGALDGITSH